MILFFLLISICLTADFPPTEPNLLNLDIKEIHMSHLHAMEP